ncbi:DUF3072 domain-containing protein [Caballeronia sp. AZ10_KS36]|uniref:DUF3072 domain-containing protein n=1 Tax=Caballeronia sp. AZ10_KS36 TaxID=2921757 RepID=UPI0020289497|nr:DUF3072 domain-containing protein [Caballeronia sp. AZ10_KS36]
MKGQPTENAERQDAQDDQDDQSDPRIDNPKASPTSNAEKDPDEWVTGDEPMTGAQASYLKTLSEEAKEPFDASLSKADASRRIDELQAKTGRGQKS